MGSHWNEIHLSGTESMNDLQILKQLPEYKFIVKQLLKQQIYGLLEELCSETGEESVIITANINNGTLSSVGSNRGQDFLTYKAELVHEFFQYCQTCGGSDQIPNSSFNASHSQQHTPTRGKKRKLGPRSYKKRKSGEHLMNQGPKPDSINLIDVNDAHTAENNPNEPDNHTNENETVVKKEVVSDDENDSLDQSESGFNTSEGYLDASQTDQDASLEEHNNTRDNDGGLKEAGGGMDGSGLGLGVDIASSLGLPAGPVQFVRKYPPKNRVNLSLYEKIAIIDEYENGPIKSQRKLAEKHNVSKSTVAEMLRTRDVLKNAFMMNANTKRKRFNSTSRFADINALVWGWFKNAREAGIQMSGPMVQEKALQLAKDLQIENFKASNGWLHSWKRRYDIDSFKDDVEQGAAKPAIIRDYSKVGATAPPGSDLDAANTILSFGMPSFNFVPLTGSDQTAPIDNEQKEKMLDNVKRIMLEMGDNVDNGSEVANATNTPRDDDINTSTNEDVNTSNVDANGRNVDMNTSNVDDNGRNIDINTTNAMDRNLPMNTSNVDAMGRNVDMNTSSIDMNVSHVGSGHGSMVADSSQSQFGYNTNTTHYHHQAHGSAAIDLSHQWYNYSQVQSEPYDPKGS